MTLNEIIRKHPYGKFRRKHLDTRGYVHLRQDGFFSTEIEPRPAPRMSSSDRWKKRPATSKYWAYKKELYLKTLHMRNLLDNTDAFTLCFYISMPKSWSNKKKKEMDMTPHKQKPDIDNLIKAFQDCLFDDDSHIWRVHASKIWAKDGGKILIVPMAND